MLTQMHFPEPEQTNKEILTADSYHGIKAPTEAGGETYARKTSDAMNMSLTRPDGMKTHQPMDPTVYDPISNPIQNTLDNRQGVGSTGYDYSDWRKARKDNDSDI